MSSNQTNTDIQFQVAMRQVSVALDAQEIDNAEMLVEQLLDHFATVNFAHIFAVSVYAKTGNTAKLFEEIAVVLALNPKDRIGYTRLIHFLKKEGKNDLANLVLESANKNASPPGQIDIINDNI